MDIEVPFVMLSLPACCRQVEAWCNTWIKI